MAPLPRSFYVQNAELVARHLLGAVLVRRWPDGRETTCRIVEAEAYTGREDLASHGRRAPTPRSRPLYGSPALIYIYKSRGIHWMFNVVCEPEDQPAAVLVRAVEPLTGLEAMLATATDGPGKLCKALGIDSSHQQLEVTNPQSAVWIAAGTPVPDSEVSRGPRVGMGKTPEPWWSMERRWWVTGNKFVSRYR
jgi:DNA-3-methyladenine glycosylase